MKIRPCEPSSRVPAGQPTRVGLTVSKRHARLFCRDWNFGYSIWNYIFRTAVNLQKNVYMYSIPDESNPERRRPTTGKEVLKGASDLLRALDSKYADVSGELKAVKGDLAKTRYCVPSLSREAVKVLDNLEARTRRIPGTQEVRTTMRLQTHANRADAPPGPGPAKRPLLAKRQRQKLPISELAQARRGVL